MRVKYMIHRSKKPFSLQKEVFRKLVGFFQNFYPRLRFVDKGLRFSIYDNEREVPLELEFDFGYRNMRYRDFSRFHQVVSQGYCALLNPKLEPGTIVFPEKSDALRINTGMTKVRVYDDSSSFCNLVNRVWPFLEGFEKGAYGKRFSHWICEEFGGDCADEEMCLSSIPVHHKGRFVESNTFFFPSQLEGASSVLKSGGDSLDIPHLNKYLQSRYDGLNLDAKQMIENVGDRLFLFSIGLGKPYEGVELTDEVRYAERVGDYIPSYDDAKVIYFQGAILGTLLSPQYQKTVLEQHLVVEVS